ncbi:hypothetical protein CRE_29851 [Caenorhabditis remanei]|uniref:Uncharacterized protein n=1 Tax=Caenorhabditis remanei TaxID=31234 RepID=E3LW41_CAERE|nr:hypothetical protein CRE_29851 [Caenorhabditis remanei]
MPTMVMANPPKTGNNSLRKRQKNKNDNIVAISYMYVGTPKKKFTFYVRERLVYRSNVEVTYEDVYNFLAHTSNDDTISLHYSVNGLYVPITTTGQLHTFIRHVHNDSTAFLYVENQDYVWNVTPQDNTHKMEKRVPAGGAPPGDGTSDPYDSMEDEDESQNEVGDEEMTEEDNSQDEEEYEEEGERDDKQQPMPIFTDDSAPAVFAEKVPVKEAFLEPKPRVVVKPKSQTTTEKPANKSNNRASSNSERTVAPAVPFPSKKWTVQEAYFQVKTMLTDALTNKTMGSVPEQVSEQLVVNVWNPAFPPNTQVLKDTVSLLKNSIGTGILYYYHKVMSKMSPEISNGDKADSMELLTEFMPTHDPEYLAEFVESALIAACDILESVQHLAHLQKEFDYFNQANEKLVKNNEQAEKMQLPNLQEIHEHLKTALVSAHFGFNLLNPVFPAGCECKEAIRLVTLELQKLAAVMKNVHQKSSSPQQIQETEIFLIENAHEIVKRFTDKECPQHRTIELALRSSEIYKWRKDLCIGYDKWVGLRDAGESRLKIPLNCYDVVVPLPAPFSIKPEGTVGDPNLVPIAHGLTDMHSNATPLNMPSDSAKPPAQNQADLEETLDTMRSMTINEKPKPISVNNETVVAKLTAAPTTTSAAATNTGEAAEDTGEKKMSDQLQAMVDKMYKSVPNQHNFVYPPPPKPGAILIPTGGLAHCRCSKNCPEFLMEPAYEYIERFNEPRQTVWEKTKQKRFKKN